MTTADKDFSPRPPRPRPCTKSALEALSRKEIETAREGFAKAPEHFEALGDDIGVAMTCHNLGLTCQEAGELDDARVWLERSLAISECEDLDGGMTVTCHQLGVVAQLAEDHDTAMEWYIRALALEEKERQRGRRGQDQPSARHRQPPARRPGSGQGLVRPLHRLLRQGRRRASVANAQNSSISSPTTSARAATKGTKARAAGSSSVRDGSA